jgi:hypothetical protein
LNTDIDLQGAMTLSGILIGFCNRMRGYRSGVPFVRCDIYLIAIWDWESELDFRAVDIGTSVQIVIAHPLQQILEMAFVRLKDAIQNSSLVQEICKPSHMHGIEHIHLEEELVSYIVAVEWDPLY